MPNFHEVNCTCVVLCGCKEQFHQGINIPRPCSQSLKQFRVNFFIDFIELCYHQHVSSTRKDIKAKKEIMIMEKLYLTALENNPSLMKQVSFNSTDSYKSFFKEANFEFLCLKSYVIVNLAIYLQSMAGLECGHMFCTLCWNEYLNTKILEENIGQQIFCPATNCSILVDENFVR